MHKHKDIRSHRNGIFDSILDTSFRQPVDKQDGGRSFCHIAFDMFAWGLGQSELWLVHSLVLMLVLMLTPFSLVKAKKHKHKHKHKKNELVHFSCAYAYVDPVFTCLHMCFCLCLCLCTSENQWWCSLINLLNRNHILNVVYCNSVLFFGCLMWPPEPESPSIFLIRLCLLAG